MVALEDVLRLDKSAIMLVLSSVMWTYHAASRHPTHSLEGHETFDLELGKGLEDVGKVILFLLPAMCLVESIDHMKGFAVVTRFIVRCTREKPGRLMPIVCVLAFFLSSVIDNLTATIVCIKILQRVVPHNQERCALFDQVISVASIIKVRIKQAWVSATLLPFAIVPNW
ncbi:unnamed protein product [Durusdinium trenchii]|uniref:Citrate transporter-like domain-containing protein n=1 Tax=Durusdinium trenchii TaxID=1381693 RepID=A0ABP0PA55_9DINO